MNPIAIFYEGTIIYWNSIIIIAGIASGSLLGLSLYAYRQKYLYGYFLYIPTALFSSIVCSRFLHWYCNQEQYSGLSDAFENLSIGGFLILGILFACWFVATVLSLVRIVPSRFSILDAFAPALAFIIGVLKLSSIYTDSCRGKLLVTIPSLQHLPFAIQSADNGQYRLATFYLTFVMLIILSVFLTLFYIFDKRSDSSAFRLFIIIYGAIEVVMDSTRYDAAHLSFPGEALEKLNKGAGFMGLSQFMGALFLLYGFIYYLVCYIRKHQFQKWLIAPISIFIAGIGCGGAAEYLLQRFSTYAYWFYIMQSLGVIAAVVCICVLYALNNDHPQNTVVDDSTKTTDTTSNNNIISPTNSSIA